MTTRPSPETILNPLYKLAENLLANCLPNSGAWSHPRHIATTNALYFPDPALLSSMSTAAIRDSTENLLHATNSNLNFWLPSDQTPILYDASLLACIRNRADTAKREDSPSIPQANNRHHQVCFLPTIRGRLCPPISPSILLHA